MLAALSQEIPELIEHNPWPVSPTRELARLTDNIRLMADSLREGIEQARRMNVSLEEQVQLRTAQLSLSEERFRTLFHEHSAIFLLIESDSGAIVDASNGADQCDGAGTIAAC